MQKIWKRIEDWLAVNNPKILNSLQPGATDAELHISEESMSIELPEDVKQSYRIHDGQSNIAPPLMGEWRLLSLKSIKKQWELMKELADKGQLTAKATSDGKVQAEWWNCKWIPIAHNGAGDFHCLDLDPTPNGSVGQMICFWHMSEERKVIASSFQIWLKEFAEDLESGRYKVKHGELKFQKT